jgi:hypothetical protein
MFKKAGYIIITGILVAVNTGITVNMHYCGDRLYSFRIYGQAGTCCNDSHCGHCQDESVKLEIHEDFLPAFNNDLISEIFPFQLFVHFNDYFKLKQGITYSLNDIYSSGISPPGAGQKLSLLQTYLL